MKNNYAYVTFEGEVRDLECGDNILNNMIEMVDGWALESIYNYVHMTKYEGLKVARSAWYNVAYYVKYCLEQINTGYLRKKGFSFYENDLRQKVIKAMYDFEETCCRGKNIVESFIRGLSIEELEEAFNREWEKEIKEHNTKEESSSILDFYG